MLSFIVEHKPLNSYNTIPHNDCMDTVTNDTDLMASLVSVNLESTDLADQHL